MSRCLFLRFLRVIPQACMSVGLCLLLGCLAGCFQSATDLLEAALPAPVEAVTIQEDNIYTTTAAGLLKDLPQPAAHAYALQIISTVFNGALTLTENGGFTYQPNPNFNGVDSCVYQIVDGERVLFTGTFEFKVASVIDPLQVQGEHYTMQEDDTLMLPGPGLLANDSDPDGGQLRARLIDQPSVGGSLRLDSDGGLVFVPTEDWSGEMSFTYQVDATLRDGSTRSSAPLTVTVQVVAVNDVPQAHIGTLVIQEGQRVILDRSLLSATDVDNSDSEIVWAVTHVRHGQFELSSEPGKPLAQFNQTQINNGAVCFAHDGSQHAPRFSLSVSDGNSTFQQIMPIKFSALNDPPQWLLGACVLSEGGRVKLSNKNLQVRDEETPTKQLQFQVVKQMGVQIIDAQDQPLLAFSMDAVAKGHVFIEHDGSETKPVLTVSLSDGSLQVEHEFVFTYTSINDDPKWINNSVRLQQGQRTIVTPQMLQIVDDDNSDTDLVITVLQAEHLSFVHIGAPETTLHQWSNQALREAKIMIVVDDVPTMPTCVLRVSDGSAHVDQSLHIDFIAEWRKPSFVMFQRIAAAGIMTPTAMPMMSIVSLLLANSSAVEDVVLVAIRKAQHLQK